MFDVATLREQFPSLQRQIEGRSPIYLDGPGGTQTPQCVLDAIVHYLSTCNTNHGGVFTTSRESDAILAETHQAAADLLNAPSPDEIVFGANMTTLTFHLSRSIGRTLGIKDEVLVTRLDHDANVRPWVLAAEDAEATVRYVDIHDDTTLNLDDFRRKLSERTKLVAVTCASNAVGTMTDIPTLVELAHEAGAMVFLDAVHYAPHALIDVQKWDCDFLACSAYKFFGPHVGILWGKREHLESLPAYKVRPASDELPDRWMTGTQNHEGLAGVLAAINYLASLGGTEGTRRERLEAAFAAIREHETNLTRQLLAGLAEQPRYRVWGITDENQLARRAPTLAVTADRDALYLAKHLAKHEIYAWHGNFYAVEVAERLAVEDKGGWLRLGLAHYNTAEEVARLLEVMNSASGVQEVPHRWGP